MFKKKIGLFLILAILSVFSFSLLACGDDDQPPINSKGELKAFALISPQHDAENVEIAPLFSWEDGNAESYRLYISDKSDFSTTVAERTNIKDTSFQLDTVLEYQTKYYWKITAVNGDKSLECNSAASFTTVNSKIILHEQLLDNFEGYSQDANLFATIYKPHPDGDTISAQLMDDGAFGEGNYLKTNYSLTKGKGWSQVIGNIPFRLKYSSGITFKVKVVNNHPQNTMFFNLKESSGENWRVGFALNETAEQTVKVPFTQFERSGSDVSNNILDFGNFKSIGFSFAGNTYTSGDIFIDDIKTYVDEGIDTTLSPTAFDIISPTNESENVDISPRFIWEDSSNVFGYEITVAKDETFGDIVLNAKDIRKSSYMFIKTLDYSTKYFWKVSAQGYTGMLDSTTVGSFTTRGRDTFIVDDFDNYTTDSQVAETYALEAKASPVDITLDKSAWNSGNAMNLEFNINSSGYAMVKKSASMDFNGFTGIEFMFKTETPLSAINVTFTVINGYEWKARVDTSALSNGIYSAKVPFTAFTYALDSNAIFNYDKINALAFSFGEAAGTRGVVGFDDIKAFNDQSVSDITVDIIKTEEVTFTLGAPFMNNMVIQRGQPIKVWGYAEAGKTMEVRFNGESKRATADVNGKFSVTFSQANANSVGQTMIFSDGTAVKKVENVVIGDVYLVSGQSNMHMIASQTNVPDSDYMLDSNMLRLFDQSMKRADSPSNSVNGGKWMVAERSKAETFSAIGFMLGSILTKSSALQNVPIGIMAATVGGTNIEEWMSSDAFNETFTNKNQLYNGMVAPLTDMKLSGIVWYQGENNSGYPEKYKNNLKAYVNDMRAKFDQPNLPYFIVQLPSYYGYEKPSSNGAVTFNYAYLRDYQQKAVQELSNCHLVVTMDNGDFDKVNPQIHPVEKRYIATRLSNQILNKIYSVNIISDSPIITGDNLNLTTNGNLVLTVANGNSLNLENPDSACNAFEIAGANGKFYTADTVNVASGSITISSTKVSEPKHYRYAFSRSPMTLNLVIDTSTGLPLTPFRSYTSLNNIVHENYDDMNGEELTQRYEKTPNVNNVTYSIETEAMEVGGGKTLKIEYNGGSLPTGNPYGELRYYPLSPLTLEESQVNSANVFVIKYKGENSGRKFKVAFTLPDYSIFRYELTDDSAGMVVKQIPLDSFVKHGSTGASTILNPVAIRQFTVNFTGTAPMTIYLDSVYVTYANLQVGDFTVNNVQKNGDNYTISWTNAVNAQIYSIDVYLKGNQTSLLHIPNLKNTLSYTITSADLNVELGKVYTVIVTAENEMNGSYNSAQIDYERKTEYVINDFDTYSDNDALTADIGATANEGKGIRLAAGAGTMTPSLETVNVNSGKAMKVEYSQKGYNQVIFENFVNPSADFNLLSLWFKVPSSFTGIITLRAVDSSNESYEYYDASQTTAANILSYSEKPFVLPINKFWSKKLNKEIEPLKLTKVYFVISPTSAGGGEFYLDDIKVLDSNFIRPYNVSIPSIDMTGWNDEVMTFNFQTEMGQVDFYKLSIIDSQNTEVYAKNNITESSLTMKDMSFVSGETYTITLTAVNDNGETAYTMEKIFKGESELILNNFDSYADTSELLADTGKIELLNGGVDIAEMSLIEGKLKLNIGANSQYPRIVFKAKDLDDKFNVLEYEINSTNSFNGLFIRISAKDGKEYTYQNYLSSAATTSNAVLNNRTGVVKLALSSFNQTLGTEKIALKASNIADIRFIFNGVKNTEVTMDNVKLISFYDQTNYSSKVTDFTSEPTENYVVGAGTAALSIDTQVREGNEVLKATTGAGGTKTADYYPAGKTSTIDYSANQLLAFRVMTNNPNLKSIIFVIVDSANNRIALDVKLNVNEPTTVVVDMRALGYENKVNAIKLDSIKYLRFKFDGGSTGNLYVDDIHIS